MCASGRDSKGLSERGEIAHIQGVRAELMRMVIAPQGNAWAKVIPEFLLWNTYDSESEEK